MTCYQKRVATTVLRLLAAVLLLGCPRMGSAAGTWSVISLPQEPGEVISPGAVAVDAAGDLYVADLSNGSRIQRRDANGSWSVLATAGGATGQVNAPSALAADAAGNLYVVDYGSGLARIQMRDAQGHWSVIAAEGLFAAQVVRPAALAVDTAGNLYVADYGRVQKRDAQGNWLILATQGASALAVDGEGNLYAANNDTVQKRDAKGKWSTLATEGALAIAADAAGNLYVADRPAPDYASRIRERDAQGSWSVIATAGSAPGQVDFAYGAALAASDAGDLYVADSTYGQGGRMQRRDTQGSWSVIAAAGQAPGQVPLPSALAVDTVGNLYVADQSSGGRIQTRDVRGHWSVIATGGDAVGQVHHPTALAVDAAGNLYVADDSLAGNSYDSRIQKRDVQGHWSVLATPSQFINPDALAVDTAGSLYAADLMEIRKRVTQGDWFVLASFGYEPGQVSWLTALAVGTAGDLYVAESYSAIGSNNRIQKRDAQGNWSVIANSGTDPGQVDRPSALAVDAAGSLYVADFAYADSGGPIGDRIQKRDTQGNWSVLAIGSGPATGQFLRVSALAVSAADSLYVADTGNSRVQVYTTLPGP